MVKKKFAKVISSKKKPVKIKTAKGRRISSAIWLERQLNDPFVQASKKDGYRSRAAYKLLEIDEKFKLIKKGSYILDLGAAPGSWSQVLVAKTPDSKKQTVIVAVDLQEVQPIDNVKILHGDFLSDSIKQQITDIAPKGFDLILSDMAPSTIGESSVDHLRIMALLEDCFAFACDHLHTGGSFVAKVFQGGTENILLAKIKQKFSKVTHFKPDSSRKESKEMFLIAQNFKG